MENKVIQLFIDLVKIPSPSGREKHVALEIKKRLDSYGIKTEADNSGKINNSDSGNIIAKVNGKNSKKTLLFVAHMDTVEKGDKIITPIIKDGNITSDNKTILGVDDKGAVAALLVALEEIGRLEKHPGVYGIFTTREEAGKMGISCIKKIPGIDFVFNLDGQGPQGTFINKSLGQLVFKIEITGEAAHSAINPEKGKNAIAAAAHFIAHIKQGRGKNALVNIGTIHGGKGTNVISDKVEMDGEIRSYKKKTLESEYQKIKKQLEKSCRLFGCVNQIQTLREASVPVMKDSADGEMIEIVEKASKELNLPFTLSEGSFTSEANFLSEMGYKVLTVCRGGTNAHSNKESITVKELISYKNLIVQIVKNSS